MNGQNENTNETNGKDYVFVRPEDIEKESFRLIGEILNDMGIELDEKEAPIIKRVIHTSADFSYIDTLKFANNAIDKAHELIRQGATIVTDTNMGLAGISKKRLIKYGCRCVCFMDDNDVAEKARELKVTRAALSMRKASNIEGPVIYVIGNAPTALIELHRLMDENLRRPDFLIGVPVGFVNVEYAKELFKGSDIPSIINYGRKGGSNIAAAIINALTLMMEGNG